MRCTVCCWATAVLGLKHHPFVSTARCNASSALMAFSKVGFSVGQLSQVTNSKQAFFSALLFKLFHNQSVTVSHHSLHIHLSRARDLAQWCHRLPCKHKVPSSISSKKKKKKSHKNISPVPRALPGAVHFTEDLMGHRRERHHSSSILLRALSSLLSDSSDL